MKTPVGSEDGTLEGQAGEVVGEGERETGVCGPRVGKKSLGTAY